MSRMVRVCVVEEEITKPDPKDTRKSIQEMEETFYYFLHWGLTAGAISGQGGQMYTGSWTVAICEHIETGQVFTFIPEYIRFVGYAKPEQKEFKRPVQSD